MNWQKRYGEWAVITGASSGIGRAYALSLARRGMNTILVARRTYLLENVAVECEAFNVKASICPVDLTQPDALDKITALTADKEVGILVNNAGTIARGLFAEIDRQRQIDMVSLHCTVPLALTHHFLHGMVSRNRGAIIMVSSLIAYQFQPFLTTYAAVKEFNSRFGQSLSWELRNSKIDVLTVVPGFTRTEAFHNADWEIDWYALPAFLKPQDPRQVSEMSLNRLGQQRCVVLASPVEKLVTNINRFLPASLVESVFGKLMA